MLNILKHFALSESFTFTPLRTGLMNETHRVHTAQQDFILQRIHEAIPSAAVEDMRVVTEYLSKNHFRVPRLISAGGDRYWYTDEKGQRWRLYSLIPGRVYERVKDAAMAHDAGRLIGRMHRLLRDLPYIPQGSIPHFHDTPYILDRLREILPQLPNEAQQLADRILDQTPSVIMNDDGGPAQIIHGDLKISNLVFDDQDRALGVIDFDTILYRSRAIDIGDAYRSWCNRTNEDDPQAVFDMDIFEAASQGYAAGFEGIQDERPIHLRAAKQIALELAARFLIDIVTDSYFAFDEKRYPSRQAHNLARAKGQFALAQSIAL